MNDSWIETRKSWNKLKYQLHRLKIELILWLLVKELNPYDPEDRTIILALKCLDKKETSEGKTMGS